MSRKISATPPEIIQNIVSHLEAFVAARPRTPLGHATNTPPRSRTQYHEDNPLKTLMLVNKAFAKAAAPAVFKRIAFFPSRNAQETDIQALMRIMNSRLATYVQTLVIRPLLSSSVDDQWRQRAQFAHALPICFQECLNLRAISIDGGAFLGLDRETQYSCFTPLLNSLRRSFMKALHSSLEGASCRKVIALELDFPLLEGLFELFPAANMVVPCSKALSQLEKLSVTVHHQPGERARYKITNTLPLQQQNYPNLKYQSQFWSLVNHATNLRSLRIHCTTILDLDKLCLPSLERLEVLDLARVRCRKKNLLLLCNPARASLTSLRLYEIRLADGVWAEVFTHLKQIPTLVEFQVLSLTYDTPSSHFARILQPLDPYLEMPRRDDRDAFQELDKAVDRRRRASVTVLTGHWGGHRNILPN